MQLPQQRAADVADADHRQREPAAFLEECLVDRVERAHLLVRVDHARDVALRRALGDGADVDVVAPERAEDLPETPGRPFIPSPTTATIA